MGDFMRILGLDLSTHSSGVSIFENNKLIYNELISPNKNDSTFVRIVYTQNEIEKIIKKYNIDYVAIEDVAISVTRNAKTCHDLLFLVGSICGLCNVYGIKWKIFMPSHWRKLAGVYDEKHTKEELKREHQKARGIELANKYFSLNLTWISDSEDKKKHDSDLAESALIALALYRDLKDGE